MQMLDVEATRKLKVEGRKDASSVFILGPRGFCIELDRQEFVAGICGEFGLTAALPLGAAA